MLISKFSNNFLDNLIKFDSNFKFKEKNILNYLIDNKQLLLIIPALFNKDNLVTNQFKTIKQWQNYIDNEFKKWVLKNNININF